jgi:tol-pal system protein YbgF
VVAVTVVGSEVSRPGFEKSGSQDPYSCHPHIMASSSKSIIHSQSGVFHMHFAIYLAFIALSALTLLPGCKSTSEDDIFLEKGRTAEEDAIKAENARLRAQLESLQQANLDLNGKLAHLEKGLQSQEESAVLLGAFTAAYQKALRTYSSRRYREAIKSFRDLLNTGAENNLTDNCQYWIGECYIGLRDYRNALVNFQRVLRYSNSDKSDDAQFMIGSCDARLGKIRDAKAAFQKVLKEYPDSEYARRARTRLKRL